LLANLSFERIELRTCLPYTNAIPESGDREVIMVAFNLLALLVGPSK
jgi:hypothetical protein